MTIEEKYQQLCNTPSDINENLSVLKKYAEQSESIVELGVRAIVSTWALLAGKPKLLISVDIEHPEFYGGSIWEVMDAADEQETTFTFIKESSLVITLPEHDFLFIDTLHNYEQLSQELDRHQGQVKKFIAMHDTAIPELPEMKQAVDDFVAKNPQWQIVEHKTNCNGMTVLGRI